MLDIVPWTDWNVSFATIHELFISQSLYFAPVSRISITENSYFWEFVLSSYYLILYFFTLLEPFWYCCDRKPVKNYEIEAKSQSRASTITFPRPQSNFEGLKGVRNKFPDRSWNWGLNLWKYSIIKNIF